MAGAGTKRIRIWQAAALAGTGALFLFLALRYDFYYDLNDDWMMGHLLSGAYTGEGELRNIQSLFPLTALLGGLYRLAPGIPWYPIFLLAAQAGAVLLASLCIGRWTAKRRGPAAGALGALLAILFFAGELWYHLIFVQYSVTAGLLLAAATVWILTAKDLKPKSCIVPAVLILLGYLLRSEMALFLLAFPALAFLYRCIRLQEEKTSAAGRQRGTFLRGIVLPCAGMLAALLVGMGIFSGIDRAACSSPDWTEFRNFFDARTTLYDFAGGAPEYAGNEAFYDGAGITREEAALYRNYDFALDPKIDAAMTKKVADYAGSLADRSVSRTLWVYRHQVLTGNGDAPWSYLAALWYLLALLSIAACLIQNRGAGKRAALRDFIFLALVFAARSALYLYLLYYNRPVVRLTHCLYLLEGILVLSLVWRNAVTGKETAGKKRAVRSLLPALLLAAAAVLSLASQVRSAGAEYARRSEVNGDYAALTAYAADHAENFYLVDVYSAVDYTEKLFGGDTKRALNWDFAGGWCAKSPLADQKLSLYGITDPGEALLGDHVFFVAKKGSDLSWLSDFYQSNGKTVVITGGDEIGEGLCVYQVQAQ